MKYNPRESTKDRKEKAQQRLNDKISVLERWNQNGAPPDGYHCPKKIGEFLAWEDSNLRVEVSRAGEKLIINGVYKLSAVTVDKPCNNLSKKRALELMHLLATSSKPSNIRAEINKLKAERDLALKEIQAITNSFAELANKFMNTEKMLRIKENQIANLSDEVATLRKIMRTVTSLKILTNRNNEGFSNDCEI